MSYIKEITVGGKSYNIVPVFSSGGQYIHLNDGEDILACPIVPDGTGYMYVSFSRNDLGEPVYPVRGLNGKGVCYGLGLTDKGGLGLALYGGGLSAPDYNIVPLGVYDGLLGVKATYRLPLVYDNALSWNNIYGFYVPLDTSQNHVYLENNQTIHLGMSERGLYIKIVK